jgi:hypothetical protein
MKQLLPVGSVVLLEGGDKRLMIYGIMQKNPDDSKQYDYIGCLYPEGFMGTEHNYLFNTEDIKKVEFLGFVDSEQQAFRVRLAEFLQEQEGSQESQTGEQPE